MKIKAFLIHLSKVILVIIVMSIFLKACSDFFNLLKADNFYSLYYPKISKIFGGLFIIIFIIGFFISLFYFIKTFKKKSSQKQLIISFLGLIVSTSFLLNLLQYKLYTKNPNAYAINSDVNKFHTYKDSVIIDNLIDLCEKEIAIMDKSLIDLDSELKKPKYISFDDSVNTHSYIYEGYYINQNNVDIYFRQHVTGTVQPPKPPKPKTLDEIRNTKRVKQFSVDIINLVNDSIDVAIIYNSENQRHFETLKNQLTLRFYGGYTLKRIIEIHRDKLKDQLLTLNINKHKLKNRGLPLGIYFIDSIKTIFGGSLDYKPLSLLGKIIEILQIFLKVIFFTPIIGEIYVFLKGKTKLSN